MYWNRSKQLEIVYHCYKDNRLLGAYILASRSGRFRRACGKFRCWATSRFAAPLIVAVAALTAIRLQLCTLLLDSEHQSQRLTAWFHMPALSKYISKQWMIIIGCGDIACFNCDAICFIYNMFKPWRKNIKNVSSYIILYCFPNKKKKILEKKPKDLGSYSTINPDSQ